MYVRLGPAARGVEVRPAPRIRVGGVDVHLPEEAAARPVAALTGVAHRGGDEETELFGIDERHPVGLVLVERQNERRQIRIPKAVRLREVELQIVALEEPVLGGEEDHGAGVLAHLPLDRLSDAPGQILRYLFHLPQGVFQAHLVSLPLVLREPGVDA